MRTSNFISKEKKNRPTPSLQVKTEFTAKNITMISRKNICAEETKYGNNTIHFKLKEK